MKDKFNNNLKKVISQLPQHTPDDHLWNNICNELDFDDKLRLKSKELPLIEHHKDLWTRIEKEISYISQAPVKRTKHIITWSVGIAALLLLVIVLFTRNSGSSEIIYSEEYIIKESFIQIGNTEMENPVDFVRQCCMQSMVKCNDPAFEKDMGRLVKLDAEIKHIQDIIATYGESPALIKSLIIMENQKAGLVKDLLKVLRT